LPHFSAADGTKIYYDVTGDGIPLLCLSGLTRNARDFDFVLPHLSGFRVIRMDYRGRGRSDWASYLSYDVPTEASDALELLRSEERRVGKECHSRGRGGGGAGG